MSSSRLQQSVFQLSEHHRVRSNSQNLFGFVYFTLCCCKYFLMSVCKEISFSLNTVYRFTVQYLESAFMSGDLLFSARTWKLRENVCKIWKHDKSKTILTFYVGILNQAEILVGPRNFHLWNRPFWITSTMDVLTLRWLMSYKYIYMEHPLLMFLDHTQRRSTLGRTPLDEWSARRRDLYLTTHDTHNRQISMPPVGFEPKISSGERPCRSPDEILGSNPTGGRDICLLWVSCVVR